MIELILLLILPFASVDGFDLERNPDTLGYSPNFLAMDLVKLTCAQAYYDGYQLGYCSKELGTLSIEHYNNKVITK